LLVVTCGLGQLVCPRHNNSPNSNRPFNFQPKPPKISNPKVREIYEHAIEAESPNDFTNAATRQLCIRYANLEKKLGEVDRARAVFAHGSALADPRKGGEEGQGYWAAWNEFEVRHGNEDTFKEMLRIKRWAGGGDYGGGGGVFEAGCGAG
jgi:hypothetical protein